MWVEPCPVGLLCLSGLLSRNSTADKGNRKEKIKDGCWLHREDPLLLGRAGSWSRHGWAFSDLEVVALATSLRNFRRAFVTLCSWQIQDSSQPWTELGVGTASEHLWVQGPRTARAPGLIRVNKWAAAFGLCSQEVSPQPLLKWFCAVLSLQTGSAGQLGLLYASQVAYI